MWFKRSPEHAFFTKVICKLSEPHFTILEVIRHRYGLSDSNKALDKISYINDDHTHTIKIQVDNIFMLEVCITSVFDFNAGKLTVYYPNGNKCVLIDKDDINTTYADALWYKLKKIINIKQTKYTYYQKERLRRANQKRIDLMESALRKEGYV